MNRFVKSVCLFFILFFTSISVQAQNQQEVVYLKNGSIVRGVIIEQIPNSSLKIQTVDGSIFAYKMEDVEKITKEVTPNNRYKRYNSSNSGSPFNGKGLTAGYRGFVDLGYTLGTGDWGEDRIEFATSHGYQFNPYIYAGLGAGAHYYFDSDVVEIPIFAHVRSEFLNNSILPFVDFKIGYTVYDATGFYMSPTVGCRFALGNKGGISIGLGYTMQKIEYYDYYYGYSGSENCGGFNIKVGFDF